MNTARLHTLAHFSVRLFAVGTAAWLFASATVSLWESPVVSRPAGLVGAPAATPPSVPQTDVAGIVRRNLFGISPMPDTRRTAAPEASETAPSTPSGDIDETTLPVSKRGWVLLGTIASTGQGEGHGVLVVNGNQKLYAVGEPVADGWVVEQVRRQCVIVVKNNLRERLLMAAPSPATPAPAPQTVKPLVMDPAALMRDISLRPASQGTWQGMEVATLRADSPLQTSGLRQGDLLLSVNGVRLNGFSDLPNLLPLLTKPELTVELVRNGKPVILRHPAR